MNKIITFALINFILITGTAFAQTETVVDLKFIDVNKPRIAELLKEYPNPCPVTAPTSTSCTIIPFKIHIKNVFKKIIWEKIRSIDQSESKVLGSAARRQVVADSVKSDYETLFEE